MDSVKQAVQRCWVVGRGFIVDMGLLPDETVGQIKDLTIEQRDEYLTKMMASHPDAFKITAGFCAQANRHVHERECMHCARQVNQYTLLTQWENCRETNLSR